MPCHEDDEMIVPRPVLLACVLIMGFLGAPSASIAETIKIVALGASDTEGPYIASHETYPAQLEAALRSGGYDVSVVNAGNFGDTTDYIRRRASAATQGAQIVIFQPGGNDMLGTRRQGGVTLTHEQTAANMEAVLKDLRARGIQVFMFQYYDDATGFNADSGSIAARYGAKFLGGFHQGVPKSAHLSDGHMNSEGYAMLVKRILPEVRAAIDQVQRSSAPAGGASSSTQ